ncbi:MAG: response regulator [Elusimicrobiota bacterium]|jgi:CheY-like chemotaxis protein
MHWILVVDDDEAMVGLLVDFLESKRCRVTSASDACQSLLQAEAVRPDIIITDLMMPVWGTGVDAYRNIRHNRHLKDVPVIFLTGTPPKEARALLPLHDPLVRLLHKPVDLEHLEKTILELAPLAIPGPVPPKTP